MSKIPLSKCFVNAEVEEAALRAIRSGQYILGKESQAFEAELAAHTGTAQCVLGSVLDDDCLSAAPAPGRRAGRRNHRAQPHGVSDAWNRSSISARGRCLPTLTTPSSWTWRMSNRSSRRAPSASSASIFTAIRWTYDRLLAIAAETSSLGHRRLRAGAGREIQGQDRRQHGRLRRVQLFPVEKPHRARRRRLPHARTTRDWPTACGCCATTAARANTTTNSPATTCGSTKSTPPSAA